MADDVTTVMVTCDMNKNPHRLLEKPKVTEYPNGWNVEPACSNPQPVREATDDAKCPDCGRKAGHGQLY